ncbi:MAG: hypothetical protein IJW47_00965 [Clostridia bacterium]|nr:hypothetical protein [Clostridia bacterium]
MVFLIIILCLAVLAFMLFMARLVGKKAYESGREFAPWAALGFFFTVFALIGLKVGCFAEKKGHSFKLWATLSIIFGVWALCALMTGVLAEDKGHEFDCWVILGAGFGVFALLITCFIENKKELK